MMMVQRYPKGQAREDFYNLFYLTSKDAREDRREGIKGVASPGREKVRERTRDSTIQTSVLVEMAENLYLGCKVRGDDFGCEERARSIDGGDGACWLRVFRCRKSRSPQEERVLFDRREGGERNDKFLSDGLLA